MKFLYSVLFFIIFSSICYFVICQNVPNARRLQTSTLVGTKLYFFGGTFTATYRTNEVWYLDLSNSFNITTPPWRNDIGMPVEVIYASSCLSPIDNSTVFLVGGRTFTADGTNSVINASSVYAFNSKTSQWTTPSIINFNSSFTRRDEIQAVIDNTGKIFIFGGTYTLSSTWYNDMNILNTTTMTWSTNIQSQSLNYADYTATLLPNGLIIYIGGRHSSIDYINMNQILIFDTKSYIWSTKIASGSTVLSRLGHSTVLTQDGNIILYGGALYDSISLSYTNIFSDLAVLNTNTWIWSFPSVSRTNAPLPLAFHSAVLYKNYMVIAFGQTTITGTCTNNVYILDIQNYTWVTSANLNMLSSQPTIITQPNNDNQNNDKLYIGIGVGGFILIGILVTAGVLIYKKYYNKPIETSGSSINESLRETHLSMVYA